MIRKLVLLTAILASFAGCAGDLRCKEPCDPFVGYNCSPCKMRGTIADWTCDGGCYGR